jgi:hypothetical protein
MLSYCKQLFKHKLQFGKNFITNVLTRSCPFTVFPSYSTLSSAIVLSSFVTQEVAMGEKGTRIIRFDEDSFDLLAHQKKADTARRERARIKRIRRQIKLGKILIAIAAVSVSVVLYYLLTIVL